MGTRKKTAPRGHSFSPHTFYLSRFSFSLISLNFHLPYLDLVNAFLLFFLLGFTEKLDAQTKPVTGELSGTYYREWGEEETLRRRTPKSPGSDIHGAPPIVSGYKVVLGLTSTHNPERGSGIGAKKKNCFYFELARRDVESCLGRAGVRIGAALGKVGAAPVLSEPDCPCGVSSGERQGHGLGTDPSPFLWRGALGARTLGRKVALPSQVRGLVQGLHSAPVHPQWQTERFGHVATREFQLCRPLCEARGKWRRLRSYSGSAGPSPRERRGRRSPLAGSQLPPSAHHAPLGPG